MTLRWLCASLVLVFLTSWSSPGWAQDTDNVFEAWQAVAQRAEDAVDANRASQEAFDSLRAEVADWRNRFEAGLDVNASSLRRVNEQIATLGPPPEEGETEPADVTARRAELKTTQEELLAPRRSAEEALGRANGLIKEIDEILRRRFADQLLQMGPWPVNPVHWPRALSDLGDSISTAASAEWGEISNPIRIAEARNNAPLVIGLFVVGMILLLRARRWTEWLSLRIQFGGTRAAGRVVGFLVSLGQILLPMLGVLAIIRAISVANLLGPRGELLIVVLDPIALSMFFAHWLGSRLYPQQVSGGALFALPVEQRRERRFYVFVLGFVYAFYILIEAVSGYERYRPETEAVLIFIPVVAAAIVLFQMGRLLRQKANEALDDQPEDRVVTIKAQRLLAQAIMAVAILAPVLGALGFINAAKMAVFSTLLSSALIGTVVLVQAFVRDLYAAVRSEEDAKDSLITVFFDVTIVALATPFLVLIWGARKTDLLDLWERFQQGISVGDNTITPSSFLTLIIVFMLGLLATRAMQAALRTSVLPRTAIDPGGQTAIVSFLGYVGITIAALVAITFAGLDLSNLAIVAGALSVGIGFGLQTIVSNFISGIILLIERPISEGDWIEVGGQMGYVRKVSVRSTRIETFDRTDVIVPNADLISGTVTNYTRGNTVGRVIINVGVAYGTDTRHVEKILSEIANAHPMALANPAPSILFAGFGADSLDFEIRIILRDVNWMLAVKNDINHQIAARFAEEGIEIPFAQRDIWLRNPETLRGQGASDNTGPRLVEDSEEGGTLSDEESDISKDGNPT